MLEKASSNLSAHGSVSLLRWGHGFSWGSIWLFAYKSRLYFLGFFGWVGGGNEGDKAAAPQMSLIKVQVMRTATKVIDRAIQVFGAAGVSDDTPLARWYASMRSLRIADGPDEVHLMAVARRELRRHEVRSADANG